MCLGCVTRRGILAAGLGLVSSPVRAEAPLEPRFRCVPRGDGRRRVALTLDACGGGFDLRIAEALLAHRVRATIFATEIWLRANPGPLALLRAHLGLFGFENHGAHHIPAVLGGGTLFGLRVAGTLEAVRQEVAGGAAAIRAATGTAPCWFRGATARYSPAALEEIARLGYGLAAYSLNGDEGASLPAAAVERRVAAARDGEVVIAHINQPHRPAGAGLARAIAALAGQGVEWVTLDELGPVLA